MEKMIYTLELKQLIDTLEANRMPYYILDGSNETFISIPTQNDNVRINFAVSYPLKPDGFPMQANDLAFFSHRYSRNTGKISTSIKTADRFIRTLLSGKVGHFRKNGNFDAPKRGLNGLFSN